MSVIYYKIWRELWYNKARTFEQEWQVGFLSALSSLHQIFIESS